MSAGTLRETAEIVGGELHGENRPWAGVSTDTRSLGEGELFFALSGPNFDGNDYVPAAAERGAAPDPLRLATVNLPIVAQARQALGNELNYIALEGYIVGRLLRAILQTVDGPLTANNFWRSATARPYEVGGITVDFTTNINGSDLITLVAYHEEGEFQRLGTDDLAGTFGTGKASAARPISASELADLLR